MFLYIAAILFGFALLIWGADRFVVGAASTAHSLGVSHLLIGLTVVGLGTSAPEMLVSADAAFNGSPGIAIGNALGSNIANIALILGLTALIAPLTVRSETLYRELPMLLAVTLLSLVPFLDSYLSRIEGFMLISGLGLMLYWLVRIETRSRANDPLHIEYESEIRSDLSLSTALMLLLVGLLVLLVSSHILVWGAIQVATELGISDLVIGLTIIAIGTSLPELAATISAALKGEDDLAVGNVIGSNMYNLLAVMGLAGIIQPLPLDPEVLNRDFPIMIGLTVILFAMAYSWNESGGRIGRREGAALAVAFFAYQGYVIYGVLR
ncbi:MAG: calcium/sodium antiporter [Gammaproteobacteria bacterium]|nr:calcium/sodium antiporter [Gammaproteobacteria bacterium]